MKQELTFEKVKEITYFSGVWFLRPNLHVGSVAGY
jgi:hypothetical protein